MEARTRTYLEGRFGDYYRRNGVSLPPAADRREWGHIPWSAGSTRMVRHQSLFDLGDLDDFLHRTAPRHVYFSSARFADPGAGSMDEKGWHSADLVFDLDADHLPGVDPEETSYVELLAACKGELLNLLDFLDDDFGFEETTVVFSGGRGYHVHVRDPEVRDLDSEARREIVDYVRAIDFDRDGLIETESHQGTTRRVLRRRGGWGARVHARLVDLAERLREMDEDAALDRLQEGHHRRRLRDHQHRGVPRGRVLAEIAPVGSGHHWHGIADKAAHPLHRARQAGIVMKDQRCRPLPLCRAVDTIEPPRGIEDKGLPPAARGQARIHRRRRVIGGHRLGLVA